MADLYSIRQHLSDWIDGKISLSEFEDWFVPATLKMQESGDLVDFIDEIELNLSEYSGGHVSKHELRGAMVSLLSKFAPSHIVVIGFTVPLNAVRSRTAGHLVSLPA